MKTRTKFKEEVPDQKFSGIDASLNTIKAGSWELFCAKCFGKRMISVDSSFSSGRYYIIVTKWRGKLYVIDSGRIV